MKRPDRHLRWLVLAGTLLLVLLPAVASAATTVRTFPGDPYLAERLAAPATPPVTIGGDLTRHLGGAPGYAAAGVQGTSPGLQGTTTVLPACATAVCRDNYRPASTGALPGGIYVERVTFTVTQPSRAGPAVGFDVDVAVHLTSGWVFGVGYFSTGIGPRAGSAMITLEFFVDLGGAVPTVTAVEVTVNECGAATGCP